MTEQIRYAWGQSSLGDFIAAMSDDGLVTFEFMRRIVGVPAPLRERFPDKDWRALRAEEVRTDDVRAAATRKIVGTLPTPEDARAFLHR